MLFGDFFVSNCFTYMKQKKCQNTLEKDNKRINTVALYDQRNCKKTIYSWRPILYSQRSWISLFGKLCGAVLHVFCARHLLSERIHNCAAHFTPRIRIYFQSVGKASNRINVEHVYLGRAKNPFIVVRMEGVFLNFIPNLGSCYMPLDNYFSRCCNSLSR